MLSRILLVFAICFSLNSALFAMKPASVLPEHQALVPRQLLPLLHANEVQQELKLTPEQIAKLESFFGEADGIWFRSRLLPSAEQTKVLIDLELKAHNWLSLNFDDNQLKRLHQLECQAQSVRMMCRADVARELNLSAEQQQTFVSLASATEAARIAASSAGRRDENVSEASKLEQAMKAEREALQNVLVQDQHNLLWELLGTPFATNTLQRIYPMAPELVPVKHWINSQPMTLSSQRGKVVLVHFYAFQCHNCHANFSIYERWHQQLQEQGVLVLGIQTPETSSERDPNLVRQAAVDRKLKFPILVDLDSENWRAWGNTMWPTVYVIDKRGYLRYWWQGEMNWQGATGDKTVEGLVARLLEE